MPADADRKPGAACGHAFRVSCRPARAMKLPRCGDGGFAPNSSLARLDE